MNIFFYLYLQSQRRRTFLVQRNSERLGQGDGWHENNYRKVCKHHRQQRGGRSGTLLASRWKQSIHDDGRGGVPVRFHHYRSFKQSSTMALHHVLPYATQMSRKPAKLSNQIPRRMGNGIERTGSSWGSSKRRILARMCHGGLLFKHINRRSILQLPEPQFRSSLRRKQSSSRFIFPRRLVKEQPRILGRFPLLDGRNSGEPQRRILRYDDPSNSMDSKPENNFRIEELRTVEGKMCRRRNSTLLGTTLLQTDVKGSSRRNYKSTNLREVSKQLPMGERSHWGRFLLSHKI